MNGGSGATNPGYHAGEEGKDGQVMMAMMVAMRVMMIMMTIMVMMRTMMMATMVMTLLATNAAARRYQYMIRMTTRN